MTVYFRAKRAKKKEKKKFVTFFIFLIIVIAGAYIYVSNNYWNMNQDSTNVETSDIQNEVQEPEVAQAGLAEEKEETVDVSNIPAKMGNYEVLGQLVIDKIGVTKNVLAISEDNSLKLSVAQLIEGPKLNEAGNFCICGHNWPNMLKRLSEMQVGDTFYMVNRKTQSKVTYEIYKMYTCVPEDLSCLDQNYDGKKEVTIITCNPGGATRLICKARETT